MISEILSISTYMNYLRGACLYVGFETLFEIGIPERYYKHEEKILDCIR